MGQALFTFFFGRIIEEESCFATRPSASYGTSASSSSVAPPASAQEAVPSSCAAVPSAAAGGTDHSGVLSSGSSALRRKPSKMEDFEIKACYSCSVPFDMLVRRHHCRRCRNIYCQKCSSQRDRLLLFGEFKPVRLCDDCFKHTPAENHFFEMHVPLLLEGATLVKAENNALLSSTRWSRRRRQQQPVYLRSTPDLSALEVTEEEEGHPETRRGRSRSGAGGGGSATSDGSGARGGHGCIARLHPLSEVEAVDAVAEVSGWGGGGRGEDEASASALVIRLRGKGQLKLEACSPYERDQWVSALGEAVRRLRGPSLADSVEQERWQRKENEAAEAQRLESAQRRRDNEASRAKMAVKYGLDPNRYASRGRDGGEGVAAGAGSGRIRHSSSSARQQQQQQQRVRAARSDDGRNMNSNIVVGFEGAGGAGGGVLRGATRFQALAGLAR